MPIRCITFDLDDTLWETEPVLARAERAFYGWLRERCAPIAERFSPDALVEHRRRHFAGRADLGYDLTRLRKEWLAALLAEWSHPPELMEEGFRVFWEHRNAVTLFDDAHPVLVTLSERYALGSITNGNADVHYIGIGHFFDFAITAADAGAAKPEPEIFHAALRSASLLPDEVVHVGDDPMRDVAGAAAVGMRTVWVNLKHEPWPGGAPADAEVRSLTDLPAALHALEGAGQ